jgi:hypothetical protein
VNELLGDDGQFETDKGDWYGAATTALDSDAACGNGSLAISGSDFIEVRHAFLVVNAGSFVLSFCAKGVSGTVSFLVNYSGPSTNDLATVAMQDTPVGPNAWQHLETNAMDLSQPGEYVVAISLGGTQPQALIDCVAIE